MALASLSQIRIYHNSLSPDVSDPFLEEMSFNAESMLRDWIGNEEYDAAEIGLKDDNLQKDIFRKYRRFANAEMELVMYSALQKLNVVITNAGVIQTAQSQKFGEATVTIASPQQIEKMRAVYFQEAEKLVYGNSGSDELRLKIGG